MRRQEAADQQGEAGAHLILVVVVNDDFSCYCVSLHLASFSEDCFVRPQIISASMN
jgi:hypothetical protein